jgi:hypothetical protein
MGHHGAGLGVHHAVGAIQQVRIPVEVGSKTRNPWIGFGRDDRFGNTVSIFTLVGPLKKVTLPGFIFGDGFLKHLGNVNWDYEDIDYDDYAAAVIDVECEDPPANTLLMCPGRKTGANLDAVFELDDMPTAAEAPTQNPNDRGEKCR